MGEAGEETELMDYPPNRFDLTRQRGHFSSQSCDEYGNPVQRTKYTHPYSYDGFVLWMSKEYSPTQAAGTVYSDRLYEWDYEKAVRLGKQHEIKRWDNTDPKRIEAFLRDWNENPRLRLVLVMEYCNHASGYPCWRFDFVDDSALEAQEG